MQTDNADTQRKWSHQSPATVKFHDISPTFHDNPNQTVVVHTIFDAVKYNMHA